MAKTVAERVPSRILKAVGTLTHNQEMTMEALREHVGLNIKAVGVYIRILYDEGYFERLRRGVYVLSRKGIDDLPMLIKEAETFEKEDRDRRKGLTASLE